MPTPILVVDAFATGPFTGNPAGVCLLEGPAQEPWMQSVASEMKHAETAFVYPLVDGGFSLRWFTPTTEVDLCVHATLASAHALWSTGRLATTQVAHFQTRSGLLTATKSEHIELDFPLEGPQAAQLPHPIPGLDPIWTGRNRMDWIVEVADEAEVRSFVPDFQNISSLGLRGLQVTARSPGEFDFVSRFFAPQSGVDEDPVTGSAHCCLGPYWGAKLRKSSLKAFQASSRGGVVGIRLTPERAILLGDAVTVLEGVLYC